MHNFQTFICFCYQVIAEDSNEEVTFQGVVWNFNNLKDNITQVDGTSQMEGNWKQVEMSLSPSTYRVIFLIMILKSHKFILCCPIV